MLTPSRMPPAFSCRLFAVAATRLRPGSPLPSPLQRTIGLAAGLTLALLSLGCGAARAQTPPPPSSIAAPSASSPTRFVVVLDPAHGGGDPGARLTESSGASEPEKDFTLALSVRLRSLLEARGIAVVTTRESDLTLSSDERAQIADHAGAQACLVLHAAISGSGVHLFLSSLEPQSMAHFLPWRTAQAAWVPRSLALAGVLNAALLQAGVPVTLGRTALPAADSMACPAVAVEIAPENPAGRGSGPLAGQPAGTPEGNSPVQSAGQSVIQSGGQSAGQSAAWTDPAYQARLAQALAAALLEWRDQGRQP